jgi:hypothetical protein
MLSFLSVFLVQNKKPPADIPCESPLAVGSGFLAVAEYQNLGITIPPRIRTYPYGACVIVLII